MFTQDGNQRNNGHQWLYTKYDRLNRPIIIGIYTHGAAQTQLQISGQISTTNFPETYNGVSATDRYTNTVWPTTSLEVLTVTYYDNYNFKTLIGGTAFDYKNDELPGQETLPFVPLKGQVTGSKINVPDATTDLWSAICYNDRLVMTKTGTSRD